MKCPCPALEYLADEVKALRTEQRWLLLVLIATVLGVGIISHLPL